MASLHRYLWSRTVNGPNLVLQSICCGLVVLRKVGQTILSLVSTSVPTGTGKPVEDGTEQTANGYGTFQTHSVEILPQTRKPVSANYPSRFKLPAISVVPYKYRYH